MKIAKQILSNLSLMVGGLMLLPATVQASAPWMPPPPGAGSDLDEIIRIGLNTAIVLAAVVAVVFLVYNGFTYMTAAGDSNKTEKAQKGIANALIGLVIVIIAGLIVNFVLDKLGVTPGEIDPGSALPVVLG